MSLLSEGLRDPDLLARAVLKRSPSPYPMQREQIVRAHLEYDRAEGHCRGLKAHGRNWSHRASACGQKS